jgi:multiple sugar transport system permease protein
MAGRVKAERGEAPPVVRASVSDRIADRRRRLPGALPETVAYLLLTVWATLALVPVYWMVVSAFKAQTENLAVPPQWIPHPIVQDNFLVLFRNAYIGLWFFNSLSVSIAVTALQLLFNSMAGYSFAKLQFPGKTLIFWGMLSMLMVPGLVTLIPLFILGSELKLLDTYWILIVPHAASIWGIFLIKQFMQTLPSELFDAARIDGCSEPGIYRRIALPLSWPALAVLGIFTFVGEWNSFFWWLLFTNSDAQPAGWPDLLPLREPDRLGSDHGRHGHRGPAGHRGLLRLPALLPARPHHRGPEGLTASGPGGRPGSSRPAT